MAEVNKFVSDLEDFETEKEKADRFAGVYIMKIIFYFPEVKKKHKGVYSLNFGKINEFFGEKYLKG